MLAIGLCDAPIVDTLSDCRIHSVPASGLRVKETDTHWALTLSLLAELLVACPLQQRHRRKKAQGYDDGERRGRRDGWLHLEAQLVPHVHGQCHRRRVR